MNMAKKLNTQMVIYGAISIIIGLVMLPIIASFRESDAIMGGTDGNWSNNSAVENVSGLTSLLDLILYGFGFGLVGLGIGMIYLGLKRK